MDCVICGSNDYKVILNLNCGGFDYSHLYDTVTVVSCNNCGHIFNYLTDEQVKGLNDYYLDEYSQCNITSPNKTGDIPGNNSIDSLNRYGELYKTIINDVKKESKILDVGCAMGGFLWSLNGLCDNLYGIDPSQRFIDIAKNKLINITQGTAEQIPFQNNTFDIVVADQVVEHLIDPNIFFLEARRVIKDNGILCISVPDASKYYKNSFFDFYFFLMREHIQHFGPSQLKQIAYNNGFTMLEYKTTFPNLISKSGKLPNLTMKFIKKPTTIYYKMEDQNKSVLDYIDESYKQLIKRRKEINNIKINGILGIYGVSREFNYLWNNTPLNKFNVKLFDDTKQKQRMRIDSMEVLPSDFIKDCNIPKIMITSFAHIETMNDKLKKLNYQGEIL